MTILILTKIIKLNQIKSNFSSSRQCTSEKNINKSYLPDFPTNCLIDSLAKELNH